MTDYELISDIYKGSRSSQEMLVRRHYKLVYGFLYRMTGDAELAKDLTQETFIKALNNLSKFQRSGEFTSWLLTVASNHTKDHFRSKAHRNSQYTYELMGEFGTKPEDHVSSIFERNEKRKEIMTALSKLPDYQREAILLKYYNDLKISEIATITETSVPTVKSRLKQGLEKLKRHLKRGDMYERQSNG